MALLATSRTHGAGTLPLALGGEIPGLEIAYETWGNPSAERSNALLLCHGYTSNPHATGWWPDLIGPGKAIDTDRWFVVCSNMIGSAYGSTGPASAAPRSGKPYGPDFPHITLADMVDAQARLLGHLGIERLAAIVGYSFGGQLALQWATTRPRQARCVVAVACGIRSRNGPEAVAALERRFASVPGWNDGHYYHDDEARAAVHGALIALRLETLRAYGVERALRDRLPDPDTVRARLGEMAEQWAGEFDANSLIALRRAAVRFDARPMVACIEAPLLYVLSRSDALYPGDLAGSTMSLLGKAGVNASYFEIDSDYGHFAPAADWQRWEGPLREFLRRHAG